MQEKIDIEKIIVEIQTSDLDPAIKEILIRDLKSFGMNDFLKEQILAYCDKAVSLIEERVAKNTQV